MWVNESWGFLFKGENFLIKVSVEPVKMDINLHQIHGAKVVVYRGRDGYVGDGIITDKKGVVIGVKTADCYPIFLVSQNVVGVLHAGWRGSIKGIVLEGLKEIYENFGVKPKDVKAIFGPGICGKCYEVGYDVASLFNGFVIFKDNGKYLLDLYLYNKHILENLGVKVIIPPPSCTYENKSLFSHRRGDRGRLYNTVVMV
ncbi:MAG: peptidoglycan editing factor PgeF [candidate division WOR-3 bacterium]